MIKAVQNSMALAAVLMFCGCATGIKRVGYTEQNVRTATLSNNYPIAIQNHAVYDSAQVQLLGAISAYDTGFCTKCEESSVLEAFRREASALGADLINVTNECYPNASSVCYRAKAEFIRFNDRAQARGLSSDPKYSPDLVTTRSQRLADTTPRSTVAMLIQLWLFL